MKRLRGLRCALLTVAVWQVLGWGGVEAVAAIEVKDGGGEDSISAKMTGWTAEANGSAANEPG